MNQLLNEETMNAVIRPLLDGSYKGASALAADQLVFEVGDMKIPILLSRN